MVVGICLSVSPPNIPESNYISRAYHTKYYCRMNTILINLHRTNELPSTACDMNPTLHSKTRIVPKSHAANVSPVVTRSRGAREITIDEIAALVSVTSILGGNIELLLALEAPVEKLKAVRDPILHREPRIPWKFREIVCRP